MSGTLYTPDIGAKINQEDVAAAGDVDASWLLYDGSSDGSPVTLGTFAQSSIADRGCDMTILSSTRAIIAAPDSNNSQFGTSVLIDISGTTPSVVDTFVFQSTAMFDVRIAKVDTRFAVVYYLDSGGTERGRVLDSNSDVLVNVGAEQNLSGTINIGAANGGQWDFDLIDSAEHICTFRNASVSSNLHGSIIGIDTGTGVLTPNAVTQLAELVPTNSVRMGVLAVTTTTFVQNGLFGASPNTILKAITGSKSGTTVSAGNIQDISTSALRFTNNPQVNDAGDTVYSTGVGSSNVEPGMCGIMTISGSTLSAGIRRGTNQNTTANTILGPAFLVYMETIGTLEYFLGISFEGILNDFGISGWEFDTDTEQLRTSLTFAFAAIRGDFVSEIALEKISSSKLVFVGKDVSNSNRLTMYTANQ